MYPQPIIIFQIIILAIIGFIQSFQGWNLNNCTLQNKHVKPHFFLIMSGEILNEKIRFANKMKRKEPERFNQYFLKWFL